MNLRGAIILLAMSVREFIKKAASVGDFVGCMRAVDWEFARLGALFDKYVPTDINPVALEERIYLPIHKLVAKYAAMYNQEDLCMQIIDAYGDYGHRTKIFNKLVSGASRCDHLDLARHITHAIFLRGYVFADRNAPPMGTEKCAQWRLQQRYNIADGSGIIRYGSLEEVDSFLSRVQIDQEYALILIARGNREIYARARELAKKSVETLKTKEIIEHVAQYGKHDAVIITAGIIAERRTDISTGMNELLRIAVKFGRFKIVRDVVEMYGSACDMIGAIVIALENGWIELAIRLRQYRARMLNRDLFIHDAIDIYTKVKDNDEVTVCCTNANKIARKWIRDFLCPIIRGLSCQQSPVSFADGFIIADIARLALKCE